MDRRWFAHRLEDQIVPQLLALKAAVFERVLPAFANVDDEAEKRSDRVLEEYWDEHGPDGDPGTGYEIAHEAAIEHYMTIVSVRQAMINALAVSAFHLFEQQAVVLLRWQLWPRGHEHDVPGKGGALGALKNALGEIGVAVDDFEAWRGVDVFRLIANTIKHADGDSAEKLRAVRRDLFAPPGRPDFFEHESPRSMRLPAFGDDLYLTEHELGAQIDNLCAFWRALARAVYDGR